MLQTILGQVRGYVEEARSSSDDFALRDFLAMPSKDVELKYSHLQVKLCDLLDRAIEQWYPPDSAFERIRPCRVEAPGDIPPPEASADSAERREVDEDAERERLLASKGSDKNTKWNPEDFVQLEHIWAGTAGGRGGCSKYAKENKHALRN